MRAGGYLDLVRELPRPTPAQTDAFATYVAGAHSWYKHLPAFPPGAAFSFFLDPNAGRSLLHTPAGDVAYVDRTDEKERFHYTWMTTTEYRERFGCWEYSTDHGPRMLFGSVRHGWTDLSPRTQVLDDDGEWTQVPRDLAQSGTCRLTALVHERLPPTIVFRPEHTEEIEAFARLARSSPDDPEVLRYLPFLGLATEYLRPEAPPAAAEDAGEWEQRFLRFHEEERARLRARVGATLRRFLTELDR